MWDAMTVKSPVIWVVLFPSRENMPVCRMI